MLPWFLNIFVPIDVDFYKNLNLPFFAPPSIFYSIAWTITYIFIALSVYKIVTTYKFKNIPNSYKITLLINYLFNQSFTLVFFFFKNLFLGFVSCLGTLITTLYLYEQTKNLNKNSFKYLRPYILLGIFATILSLFIYIMNA